MIVRRVGRLTIAKLLGMYKSGRHFVNGQLTEEAKPYFLYRRARRVALRPPMAAALSLPPPTASAPPVMRWRLFCAP